MFRMVSVLSSIALLSAPLAAQTTPSDAPAAAPAKPAKVAKPRKICRTETGANSRISASVCKTAEQWASDQAANDGHVAGNNGR